MKKLGLTPYQGTSNEVKWKACLLAIFVPFETASTLLQELNGIQVSASSIWRWVQDAGQRMQERLNEGLNRLEAGVPAPPDLAVEVVSRYDSAADIREKAQAYLENGTRLLWVVYPKTRIIDVYQPGQPVENLGEADTLTGGDAVAGFSVPVAKIFA